MENELNNLRHSCAHLLAAAVLAYYPDAKPTLGPPVDNGFYYDFDFGDIKVSENDLVKIEQKMHELSKSWRGFERMEVTPKVAAETFKDNPYKLEMISDLVGLKEKITFYKSGDFVDLCRGGHIDNAGKLKYFKLLSVAGAYWRGSEKNKMLSRIYGTCFATKEELDKYLWQIEEAKKRDHRKLGKLLDLFTFSDLVGSGLPLWTQKGALIRRLLNDYVESIQVKQGYMQVWTPQITKADLFKISGHYDKYKENLFRVTSNYSEEEFFLKPMNCPQHTQIYASRPRSYRDLPIRMTDFAMLYRDEKPGELNGLARVRSFSQDDCHVFCREDQVEHEVDMALAMTKEVMKTFGFRYRYRLSTRDPEHPEKYIGDPKTWDKAEAWAEKIIKRNKIDYFDGPGEAAFYAPKMDLMVTDALGREWQLSTIQIDYFMPEKFNLTYADKDGTEKRPIMIHRAIIGSPERFIMILLEHYAGALPLWLAPTQIALIPISEKHQDYAKKLESVLSMEGIRVTLDDRAESMQNKIRAHTLQKAPYLGIMGDKEVENNTISLRKLNGENLPPMSVEELIHRLNDEIERKA